MPRKAVTEGAGKRVALNMKTTEVVRARLEEAAAASGRSLTQEVEWRIDMSFQWEREFGNVQRMRTQTLDAQHRQAGHISLATSEGTAWFESPAVMAAYTRPSIDTIEHGVLRALEKVGLAPANAEEDLK